MPLLWFLGLGGAVCLTALWNSGRRLRVADAVTGRGVGDSQGLGRSSADTPQDPVSEGGSGRIGVSAYRKTGSHSSDRVEVGRICFRRHPPWPITFLISAPGGRSTTASCERACYEKDSLHGE